MEEDIKILEEIDITDFYNNYNEYTFPEEEIKRKCQAIENLLTRYKQLEEENKKKDDQIEYIENEYGRTIEEKDKVINEMAKWISKTDTTIFCNKSKYYIIQQFEYGVEREGK